MINLSGYITDVDEDIVDQDNFIAINSCGYYKLVTLETYETTRLHGRADFQMIYVHSGVANFRIAGELYRLSEGSAVIYAPHEPQYYVYHLSDKPEIYWFHFSGADIENHLKVLGFKDRPWFQIGVWNEYATIFDKIIKELQLHRRHFAELSNLYALELLSLMSRNMAEFSANKHVTNRQIQSVIEHMNKHFNTSQNISDYADLCNMSTCWFINCFKAYTGTTPQQYITNIRISKAKELLLYSSFNISEISSIVGYENPFYFSRIFKKNTNLSPREYKYKSITIEGEGFHRN